MWKDGTDQEISDIMEWIQINIGSGEFEHMCVGCDAGRHGHDMTFISAIVLDRKHNKGSIFAWKSDVYKNWKENLGAKLMKEAELIVELVELTKDFDITKEAHIDINTKSEEASNTYLSSIRGWIEALGITVVPKPFGYASSSVADRFN